jgi:uncharacterized protein YjbJ (UPF0337 family)
VCSDEVRRPVPLKKALVRRESIKLKRKNTMGDIAQGQWKQIRGQVKEQWGKLTDDDLDRVDGQRDQLVGRVQELYGRAKVEAEKEVDRFFAKY